MSKIVCYGWSVGLKKISLIKYLNEECGYSLKEAKDLKDRLVDKDEIIELTGAHLEIDGNKILLKLQELGVKCRLEN
jgi:ribosomal protein L7/L12